MTKRDGQSMFLSLDVPEGHFTCIVPWEGKHTLAKFSRAYQSNVEVEGQTGRLSNVTTPDHVDRLVLPLHGETLMIRYNKGGSAFLDYNDDSVVLILPSQCAEVLRSTVDVRDAYEDALRVQQMLKKTGPNRVATRKFKELLRFAIRS